MQAFKSKILCSKSLRRMLLHTIFFQNLLAYGWNLELLCQIPKFAQEDHFWRLFFACFDNFFFERPLFTRKLKCIQKGPLFRARVSEKVHFFYLVSLLSNLSYATPMISILHIDKPWLCSYSSNSTCPHDNCLTNRAQTQVEIRWKVVCVINGPNAVRPGQAKNTSIFLVCLLWRFTKYTTCFPGRAADNIGFISQFRQEYVW